MNGVQTRLKCKPNVKRCKRFVFAAHSPLLHPNTLKTKAIIHFQTDHILTRFVFPPLDDPGDRKIIGNSTPRFRFGLDLGVEWKGIDFSMFWQGVAKRDLWLDGLMFWGISGGEWQSTGLKEHLDYYRPENTTSVFGPNTNAYFPKMYMSKDMNQKVQTRYLQNGAYARLKNIQLGYTFPTQIINKLHMQKLRVYVSAENVLTITSLPSGFDPETTYSSYSDGNSGKTYPLQTTISFGLHATF